MSRSRQFNYTLLVPFVQSGNGFEIPFIGFPCLNPFFKFTSDLTQGKSGELPPVHSLQEAVPKKNRQQQRKQCNIVLPNKTSKTWHPINNNEWIFIFRAHNKTFFIPTVFFLPAWQKFEPTLPRARPHVKHCPIKYSQAAANFCFSVTLPRSVLRVLHAICSLNVSLCVTWGSRLLLAKWILFLPH